MSPMLNLRTGLFRRIQCGTMSPFCPHVPLRWHTGRVVASALALWVAQARAADQVQIALVGEIEKSCAVSSAAATVDLGSVVNSGSRNLSLGITCNTPFQYSLTSANGGLRHAGSVTRVGAFADLLPYRVKVTVPTDAGGAAFSCDSANMTAGASRCGPADSGSGITLGRMASLSLSWQAPQQPLIAGSFEDALTISFSVKP